MMTYKERLCCWAISVCYHLGNGLLLPASAPVPMPTADFQFLRQTIPHVKFEVVFDLSGDSHRLSATCRPSNPVTSAL